MARGLGKGINALFSEIEKIEGRNSGRNPYQEIRPNPYQPRKYFSRRSIDELKQSIVEHGVLQPIIAGKVSKDMKSLSVRDVIGRQKQPV